MVAGCEDELVRTAMMEAARGEVKLFLGLALAFGLAWLACRGCSLSDRRHRSTSRRLLFYMPSLE
jgi:hypothetical protein